MKNRAIILLTLITVLASCKTVVPDEKPKPPVDNHLYCANGFCVHGKLVEEGKIYVKNDRAWLWAGQDSSWHFDITGWEITTDRLLDYGYHRETFEALLEPKYVTASEEASKYRAAEQVILLHDDAQTKVYPLSLMQYHEVVNEEVDGEPVMIAYCYLADLKAVYRREICGKTLTFGVSGYTNAEEYIWDDKQGFVLWDRETQSLWWPLMDQAISGVMKGNYLLKAPSKMWEISTWEKVLADMPEAVVLASRHDWVPPTTWPELKCEDLDCCEG